MDNEQVQQADLIAGERGPKEYKHVPLEDIIGKTVEGIAQTAVEGSYGDEPCVLLLFTDGSMHGFVLPTDD